MQCQFCRQKFHATCLTKQELSLLSINNTFQCTECNLKFTQYLSYNYNRYPYAKIPNARPMTVVPQQVLIAPKEQIPLNQIKNNNNNKKNKNLSNKSKKQYKKNEEIVIEDDPEDNNQINEINNINTNVNQFNMIRNNNNNNMVIGNMPQIINSFYYINNNAQIAHMQRERERQVNSNDTSVNYNEEMSNNNINSINNNSSLKNKKKSKPKKYNCIFNKNTLQILENMSITNEDKLLYILNNFRNIRIDPLIIKVLEDRKTKKRINIYESILSEDQNTSSANEKERQIQNNKNEIVPQNNYQNSQNEIGGTYTVPQPAKKIVFPIDDNILFSNLEKYKLSEDILDRPLPKKIDLDFHMLNKLFIVWDFLLTFKDIVFTEKSLDNIDVDKNILVFYDKLINEENDCTYYKNIYVSLLLICVKNIPLVLKSPKEQRIFLLKSILDNLHSTSFNIILDSPLIVLKEVVDCYIYSNSIEENNFQILNEILKDVNNKKHRESYERNKNIYERDEFHEDNLRSLDINTKIFLLHIIIGLCFETVIVKEKIKKEYDSMAALSYQKKTLEESQFETEKRLKELSRMEDFSTLNTDIENKERRLEEIKKDELINTNLTPEEEVIRRKEKEDTISEINRMKSLFQENEQLNEKKQEINNQINDTIEKIYNLKTLRKKYLGIDYQGNEYYYFITGEGVIYTKNRKKEEWAFFDNKNDIEILINKLTEKGKNEKKLKNVLKFFLAQMKEKEQKEKLAQEKKEQEDEQSNSEDENDGNIQEEEENINDKEIPKVKIDLSKKTESDKKNNSDKKIYLRSGNKKKGQSSENDIHILESDSDIEIKDASEDNNTNDINTNSKELNDKNNNINPLPKRELITFVLSEERLPLNIILINIEQIFSDYLVQFNKQWESEENRKKWREVITNYATDKNILISLKMFNLKFKNPYKILAKDEEIFIKDKGMKYYMNYYSFEEENGGEFKIPETNLNLILSPKVKIWSKEMDLIDIDFYYSNDLLLSVFSREQLCYLVHFYEMAIFGLVHRREGKRKL